jgi:transposase
LHPVRLFSEILAHAVILMDQAGWHTTGALTLPENLSLIFLPLKSPELNPVENISQYFRQTWLANRVELCAEVGDA